MLKKAILILAAGAASRFGSPKQLARIRSKTLIQRTYDCATQLFPDDTFVVLGAHRDAILEELIVANSIPQSRILYNRNWALGIGESINFGIQVLESQYDEIMIILADQVQITPRDIQTLVDSCVEDAIICADYNGGRGVPAIFPRRYFEHLTGLSGDTGAKALLQLEDIKIIAVPMPNAAIDVDYPDDLVNIE